MAQISLLQATLSGVTAFMLAGLPSGWGVPFPLAPLIAVAVGDARRPRSLRSRLCVYEASTSP